MPPASNQIGAPDTGPAGPMTVPDTRAVGSTRNWKSTPARVSPDQSVTTPPPRTSLLR
jgi:hypothetical protein